MDGSQTKNNTIMYREGQLEYFGKKKMSLLGFILIKRLNIPLVNKTAMVETNTSGLEY